MAALQLQIAWFAVWILTMSTARLRLMKVSFQDFELIDSSCE
jgi:hypothetical protein